MSKKRDQESKRERTNPKIILLVAATMRVPLSILKNVCPCAYNLLEILAKSLLIIQ